MRGVHETVHAKVISQYSHKNTHRCGWNFIELIVIREIASDATFCNELNLIINIFMSFFMQFQALNLTRVSKNQPMIK